MGIVNSQNLKKCHQMEIFYRRVLHNDSQARWLTNYHFPVKFLEVFRNTNNNFFLLIPVVQLLATKHIAQMMQIVLQNKLLKPS